jgi:hypothetical protein
VSENKSKNYPLLIFCQLLKDEFRPKWRQGLGRSNQSQQHYYYYYFEVRSVLLSFYDSLCLLLSLENNNIGDDGAAALAEAIKLNRTLTAV